MIETLATIAGILLVLVPILGFVTILRLIAERERQIVAQYELLNDEE